MLIVEEHLRDGERILEIHAEEWRAEIVLSRGANLWRLRHASGAELLRTPPSMSTFRDTTEMWGIPVLFPPNRIAGGRFAYRGREYRFPINDRLNRHHIHGMVSRQPWELERVDGDAITLCFKHTRERDSYEWFPHAFELRLQYRFLGSQIRQMATMYNCGELPLPFGFGFHTAFRLPFSENSSAESCRVRVTAGDWQWELSPEDSIPTGRRLPLDAEKWNRGVVTEPRSVFIHAPIEDWGGFRGAVLESPAERVRVIYETDRQFSYWVLWNYGGGKGFFCPEPQTWAINAPNLPAAPEVTGIQALAPHALWSATNRILLERIPNLAAE